LSHAWLPAIRLVQRGQLARSAAARTPTDLRPESRRPTTAVATTVTAFARRLTARPKANARSGARHVVDEHTEHERRSERPDERCEPEPAGATDQLAPERTAREQSERADPDPALEDHRHGGVEICDSVVVVVGVAVQRRVCVARCERHLGRRDREHDERDEDP
jgi:hypothetical protein